MKIFEVLERSTTPESNLVTALELLRMRGQNVINTKALINLVRNTDQSFSYDSLIAANESNPAVQNLVKNINKQQVELHPADEDSADETTTEPVDQTDAQSQAFQEPVMSVSDMAKRAAKERGAPVSQ